MDLTKEQRNAFNRLKKAFKACEDANVVFYSVLSVLHPANGHLVKCFESTNDSAADNIVSAEEVFDPDYIAMPFSDYSDDGANHVAILTEAGRRALK